MRLQGATLTALLLAMAAAPPLLASALENGRARLPPLGWSSWNQYKTGVNETHVRDAATALVSTGLAAKGWRTVVISDGWPGGRESTGRLYGDKKRFPSGMKALCQYINSLGLECGIYNSMGNRTCGGFAGGWRHEDLDAATYVDWGVKWFMHDTCWDFAEPGRPWADYLELIVDGGRRMRDAFNKTGQGVTYFLAAGNVAILPKVMMGDTLRNRPNYQAAWPSIEGPSLLKYHPLFWAPDIANILDYYDDLHPNWASMLDNVHHHNEMRYMQRPGFFNTPDNHIWVGQGLPPEQPNRFYLTNAEQRSQFSLWSIFGSPMLISFNVGSASNVTLAVVGNAEVLAVDQDPLGVQGSLVNSGGDDGSPCAACETYVKPLHDGSFAVVLLNKGEVPTTAVASFGRVQAESVGNDFRPAGCVNGGNLVCGFARAQVRDLWEHHDLGEFDGSVNVTVDAHGAAMLKVSPIWPKNDDDESSSAAGLKTDDELPMVDIFVHGDGGFPCWRVPAVVMAASSGRLFAFAEARNYSGDGCEPDGLKSNMSHPNEGPRSLALKTSTDSGHSWHGLRVVDWNGINPAAVYDLKTDKVIVHYPAAYYGTGKPAIGGGFTKQIICSSDGVCGAPTPTSLYWPGCSPTPDPHCRMHISAGPGLGVQLASGPHAGRLLFSGHAGQVDVTWFSDDSAVTWTVANSTFGSNNKTKGAPDGPYGCGRPHGCFDEPFPVQLPTGVVQLNMRNNSLQCDPSNCCCTYLPITHPRSVADSTDGGLTFGPAYQQHDLPEPTGGCQASSIVVGDTILFANPASGNESRSRLTLRRSVDSGKTYPPGMATLVWPGPGGYSCLTRLPNLTAEVGLVFERSALGCNGGSCRISFVRLPVTKADNTHAA